MSDSANTNITNFINIGLQKLGELTADISDRYFDGLDASDKERLAELLSETLLALQNPYSNLTVKQKNDLIYDVRNEMNLTSYAPVDLDKTVYNYFIDITTSNGNQSVPTSIGDLTDVSLSGLSDDNFIKYNASSGEWNNFSIANPTLVSPTIAGNEGGTTNIWKLFENDGTTPYSLLSGALTNKVITVDAGVKVEASAYFSYPAITSGFKGPDSISGSFGTTDPGENTNSATFTHTDLENGVITSNAQTNKGYSVTLTAAKQGLQVSGSNVVVASGNDVRSDTITVQFRHRIYAGYSTNSTLNEAQIKALSISRFGDNSETFTGVTATMGNYFFFYYDSSFADISNIILDGASPVLGAFTQLSTVNITNAGGISKTLKGIRSNATNAFSNNSLAFS